MSRQISRESVAEMINAAKEAKHVDAIVTALRISGQDAQASMSVGSLVTFGAWVLGTGRISELRRVTSAMHERQYDDSCFVYFIGDPRRKVVKIGVSTDVGRRLTAIQTGYPYPLSILCVIPGDEVLESELQRIFSPLRTNGEWFRYDGRIRAYVGTVNAELFARVVGE